MPDRSAVDASEPVPGPARPRRRLSRPEVIAAAVAVVDEHGADALTTTAVARRLGVTQPAIYTHIRNVDELRSEVARRGIEQLSESIREATAGHDGDAALEALATAYRDYVRRHPQRYLLQLRLGGTEPLAALSARASEPVRSVLRSYGLVEGRVRQTHALLRAAIHGFVDLEAQGLIGAVDPDADFEVFVALLRAGLHATESTHLPGGTPATPSWSDSTGP